MTARSVWDAAHRSLQANFGEAELDSVSFVYDADVTYDPPRAIRIPAARLFDIDADQWSALLDPAPAWIHFNLLRTTLGRPVVSVRRSERPAVEPGSTAVNVSVEPTSATLDV